MLTFPIVNHEMFAFLLPFRSFSIWKSINAHFSNSEWTHKKSSTQNAFYLSKTAISFKIAPTSFPIWKSTNAHFYKSKTEKSFILHHFCSFFLLKSTNDRFWKSKRVVQKFFGGVSGWVSRWVSRGEPRNISLCARPAHTLRYPWPEQIPCQLRSPKDIIKSQDAYLLGKN